MVPFSVFLGMKIDYMLFFPGLLIALILFMAIVFHRYTRLYRITPEYLEIRKGLLSLESVEMACRDIRAIVIRQGIFARIFAYGDVEISTAAETGVKFIFIGINNPQRIRDLIRSFRGIENSCDFGNNNIADLSLFHNRNRLN